MSALADRILRIMDSVDVASRTAQRFRDMPHPSAVLAIGKSAGPMIDGALRGFPGPVEAVAILPENSAPAEDVRVKHLRSGHPLPDERVTKAAQEAMRLAAGASSQAPLWLCLSGGTSACVGAPLNGDIAQLREVTQALMMAGASIFDLNTVRKHLCDVLGGRLGAAAAAVKVAVAMDIAEEEVALVGSGPAVQDVTPVSDAARTLIRHGVTSAAPLHESPTCPAHEHRVVASPTTLKDAFRNAGLPTVSATITTPEHALLYWLDPPTLPGVIRVVVGEVPFRVPSGSPPGGRCTHMALWAAEKLRNRGIDFELLSLASDGRDGPTDACGAALTRQDLDGWSGAEAQRALEAGEAHLFLSGHGKVIPRRPSRINLLDVHVLSVAARPGGG